MRVVIFTLCIALLTLMAGGITGCGGGSSTPPPTPTPPPAALFSGPYFYQSFGGNFAVPRAQTWWGDLMADGVSQFTGGTLGWNDGTLVIGSGALPALPYVVDAARRMTWPTGGPFNMQGAISDDGRVAALGSIGNLGWPTLTMLIRRSGTFNLASLNGAYRLMAMFNNGVADLAMWGTVTFNGAGGATEMFTDNGNGTIGGPFTTAQTYTVAPDGTVTYTFTPGSRPQRGGILFGGDLVVLTGATAVGPRGLVVLIRQSTTASAATLTGPYHITGFSAGVIPPGPPPSFASFTGTGSANGVGVLTTNVGGLINVDGAVSPWPPAVTNDTYTVAPNGTLTVTTFTSVFIGAVSPTGAFGCVAGGTTALSAPQLWFWLR